VQRELTPSFIAECLSYDPLTGELRWRERPRAHFASDAAFKTHLRTKAGKLAGCLDLSTGYIVIGLSRKLIYAHRAAWVIMHGEWPSGDIDHVDGDRLNNAASNLRSVSHAENCRNSSMKSFNRSGAHGIGFAKREGKWRARIMRDYRDIHLGYFSTREEAVRAREEASAAYGFHENHGRAK